MLKMTLQYLGAFITGAFTPIVAVWYQGSWATPKMWPISLSSGIAHVIWLHTHRPKVKP